MWASTSYEHWDLKRREDINLFKTAKILILHTLHKVINSVLFYLCPLWSWPCGEEVLGLLGVQ